MKKAFKIGIYVLLSTLSFNIMANNAPIEKEITSKKQDKVIYKLHENGINIIGNMKKDYYKNNSDVSLYVFKKSVKSYKKYTTSLQNDVFVFENIVKHQSPEYIKHYEGEHHYKIVITSKGGKTFNKTYKIINNKYSRVKIDLGKGLIFPTDERQIALASNKGKGIQKKARNKRPDMMHDPMNNPMHDPMNAHLNQPSNIVNNTQNNTSNVEQNKRNQSYTQKPRTKANGNSSELNGYLTRLNIIFKKYEKEYEKESDKYSVSSKFKAELRSDFKSNNRIPNSLCKPVTKTFAKAVYNLTKELKANGVTYASSVLKNIRRFRICK